MKLSQLNLYGYKKDVYNDCKDLIRETNLHHMEILNLRFLFITAVYLFVSLFNTLGMSSVDAPFFAAFLVVEAAFQVALVWADKFVARHIELAIYLNVFSLLAFGIVCSAARPYMAATLYPVILVVVALSYVDRYLRMMGALIFGSVIFLVLSYIIKPGSIYQQDLFNVVVVFLLSTALQYTFQHARMRQFITFMESIRMQHELEISSSFDILTGLLNRGRFFNMVREVIRQETGEMMVLGIIDLDKFKEINDTLGHQMGDKVIQMAGNAIRVCLGEDEGDKWDYPERAVKEGYNFAGRLGGDEFVVLIRNLKNAEEATTVFNRILRKLNAVQFEGLDGIKASIGVAVVNKNDLDVDKAYSKADAALYASKESGRNRISVTGGV
ncbi:MAG: GGDEF domain-containing protein [Lachnospiraceae bacterium]|nr:GGDEF domain-containing protein [Lachnospiraceae bacterium]